MNLLRQQKKLEKAILDMKENTLKMYTLLSEIVEEKDEEKIYEIIKLDEQVNENEEVILEETIVGIALLAPVATDLRTMVSCIRISHEIERIADYAKNISEYFMKYKFNSKTLTQTTIQLILEISKDLGLVVDSFLNRDIDVAYDMKNKIDKYNHKFQHFFSIMNEKEHGTFEQLYHVYVTFKSLERAKDHMLNMCECLVYLQTGKFYNFE